MTEVPVELALDLKEGVKFFFFVGMICISVY